MFQKKTKRKKWRKKRKLLKRKMIRGKKTKINLQKREKKTKENKRKEAAEFGNIRNRWSSFLQESGTHTHMTLQGPKFDKKNNIPR